MEEFKSILTAKMWAFLILISAMLSLIGVFSAPFAPSWTWSTLLTPSSSPLVVLFIVLLLSKIFSKASGLSPRIMAPQNLALLYVVSVISIAFCYSWVPYSILHNAIATRQWQYDWHPSNWAVKDLFVFGPIVSDPAEIVPATEGHALVPWNEWAPFLGWWIIYMLAWLLFFIGWYAILEERWIRIEKLPYPGTLPGTLQIQLISQKEKDPRIRYFMLGFILGFLTIVPIVAHYLNPSFPDIYGWTKEPFVPWAFGTLYFGMLPGATAIPVISFLPVNPQMYMIFYLAPTKVLFTIWFFQLFAILIPSQIAFYMGYYTDLVTMGDRHHAFMNDEPFRWNGVFIGAFVGLLLTWLFLNASYLKGTFKKSKGTAISNPVGWLIILLSTVAIIVLLVVANVNTVGALLIVFTMWVIFLSAGRMTGFTAEGGAPTDWTHTPFLVKHLYIPDPGVRTAEITVTLHMANRWTVVPLWTIGGWAIPSSYKVAYDAGANPRDVTKIIIVSGIVSILIGFTAGLWLTYTVGSNNIPMGLFDSWWHWVFGQPWGDIAELGIPEPLWQHIIAGVILILIVSVLNFKFAWWPLEPAGVAASFGSSGTGYLLPAGIAWIIKNLVLRIGGTKLNDNVAMPLAIGFLVGYWFLLFIGGLLGMIQFFLPK
jgi:hypothetical protein